MPIEIVVNGQTRSAPEGENLVGLLRLLELDPARVAVELDRCIVRRAQWEDTIVQPGSHLEIVQFVGGG